MADTERQSADSALARALLDAVAHLGVLRTLAETVRDWNIDHEIGWVPLPLQQQAMSAVASLDGHACARCGGPLGLVGGLCVGCVEWPLDVTA